MISLVCVCLPLWTNTFKTVEITFCLSHFTTYVFHLIFSSLFHVIPGFCFVFVSVVISRNLCLLVGKLFKVDLFPSASSCCASLSELIMSQVDAQDVCPRRAFNFLPLC